jgi:hypothetical protein
MFSLVLSAVLSSSVSMAATPFKVSLDAKKNSYMREGVFTGGRAGSGTSLLAVRRSFSAKLKLERVILDMGDKEARPAGRDLGFFQASMDSANNRIVLDLSQLRLSKVSEVQVQRLFKKDPFVSSVSLTLDPEDKAGTLVLNLRRPMKLEVFQLLKPKSPARIVMDLTPLPAAAAPAPAPAGKI